MSIKEKGTEYLEDGFSKIIEKGLEKYFISHKEGIVPSGLYGRIITEVERAMFNVTLRHCGGNQLQASKILGINRNTLRKKMIKLNIGEDNN
jgi:two-component system nitrogen regulation response regulator GlnG